MLPYVPKHQYSVMNSFYQEGWKLSLSYSFIDEMKDRASSGDLAAYEMTDKVSSLDMTFLFDIDSQNVLYMKAENLLNSSSIVARRPFGARPQRPFFIEFGYKYGDF